MNIFKIIMRLKGFPIKPAIQELTRISSLSQEERKKHLEKKSRAILKYHLDHNPAYKQFCQDKAYNWEDVPILKKTDLQSFGKSAISSPFTSKGLYTGMTSGTYGLGLHYAKDKFAHAMTWADAISRYERHGIEYGSSLQARFYGTPSNTKGRLKQYIKDIFSRRKRFTVQQLTDIGMARILKDFQKTKFDYLYGYTSAMVLFATYLEKEKIILKDICPSIQSAGFTSELCTPSERILLERAFGVPVFNEYGLSEAGVLACDDENGDWLLNDRIFNIEIVDDNDKLLPYGEVGRIILTSLYNKAMPFIRYETGDTGAINKLDNKLILEKFSGRISEYLIYPDGSKTSGILLCIALKGVMAQFPELKESRIRQTAKDRIIVDTITDNDLGKNLKTAIIKSISSVIDQEMSIEVNSMDTIERTKAGKFKRFECLIND